MGVEQWWNDTDSGKKKDAEKNLSGTNLTCTCLGLNQGLCSVIKATNRLSCRHGSRNGKERKRNKGIDTMK
jgi:hypothetical protein